MKMRVYGDDGDKYESNNNNNDHDDDHDDADDEDDDDKQPGDDFISYLLALHESLGNCVS